MEVALASAASANAASAPVTAWWWRRLVNMPGSEAAPPVASARMRSRKAGMPSPVSAEVGSDGESRVGGMAGATAIWQIALVDGDQGRAASNGRKQTALLVVERLGGVENDEHQSGVGQRFAAAGDAQLLHLFKAFAQSRSVDQL